MFGKSAGEQRQGLTELASTCVRVEDPSEAILNG
jgi:hypothetical protein